MDKIHLPKEIYERLDLKENEEIEIVDLAADSFTIRKINARKSDKAPKWFIIPTIISAFIFIIFAGFFFGDMLLIMQIDAQAEVEKFSCFKKT